MAASRRSTRASAVKIVLILHDLQSILWSRRGLSIESLMGLGCVKTRRRAIAIEQTFRQSRAFNAPKLKGCSVPICPRKIFSSRFNFLRFYTPRVRIGGWPVSAARRLISKSDNILTALIRQRVPLPTELHCSNLARIGGALLEARVILINGQAQRIGSCRQWRPQLRAEE
jgi:hypothetical protein